MTGPDLSEAARFLQMLGTRHTFQTFDDGNAKERTLSRILHGNLSQHAATLADLNARGAGVFVMVNEGDGKGRKADNVRRVRALFVDLDGAPLAPVTASPLPTHCTVESSPGRWHAYWCVSDCPPDQFTALQKLLAVRFDADPKVCDLPRVMRLPGFDHRKAAPFSVRLQSLREDVPPYSLAQIRQAFPLPAVVTLRPAPSDRTPSQSATRRRLPDTIPQGERNAALFSLARGLVSKGHAADQVNQRLQRINAERCTPPLCASEVDTIAANACAYGSDGFARLPHALLDSPQWKASARSTHEIVLLAFRRFDGRNNGRIALTWADFEGREGFGKKAAFYTAREAAVTAGFLILGSEGQHSQTGRKPDLFAIASCWLPNSAWVRKGTLRMGTKGNPYIDKQVGGESGLDDGEAAA